MSGASNYTENQIVDHLFRSGTWAKPAALWIALVIGDPLDNDSGGAEVAGGSYARVNLPPLDTNWLATQGGTSGASSGTGGVTGNAVDVQFAAPTGDWGTPTHFKIMSASSGGNMLGHGPISNPTEILNGSPAPRFAAGSLIATVA